MSARFIFVERCQKLLEYAEAFPKIGKCWFGPVMLKLYIHDPDYIQKIYNASQCLQKPDFYRFFGWGSGLVTADGEFLFFFGILFCIGSYSFLIIFSAYLAYASKASQYSIHAENPSKFYSCL